MTRRALTRDLSEPEEGVSPRTTLLAPEIDRCARAWEQLEHHFDSVLPDSELPQEPLQRWQCALRALQLRRRELEKELHLQAIQEERSRRTEELEADRRDAAHRRAMIAEGTILRTDAQRRWATGYSVTPLERQSKRPEG